MSESLLDINLSDAKDFRTLADNDEVHLTISQVDIVDSKSTEGRRNLKVILQAEATDVESIYYYMPVPSPEWKADDARSYQYAVNRIDEFCRAFDIRFPINSAACVGRQGWCIVGEEKDDRTGKMRNTIRRCLVSRA